MTKELDSLVQQHTLLTEQIEKLEAERTYVKGRMRELATVDAQTPSVVLESTSGLKVTVAVNRRLDAAALAQRYPVTRYPMFYKAVPDTAALKATLSPIEYEGLMAIVGEAKVTIR